MRRGNTSEFEESLHLSVLPFIDRIVKNKGSVG